MLAGRITRGTSEGARYEEPEAHCRCKERLDAAAVARCGQRDLDRLRPRAVRGHLEHRCPADTERLSFDPKAMLGDGVGAALAASNELANRNDLAAASDGQ